MNWFQTVFKRLLLAVPTLLLVSVLGFGLMRYSISFGPIDIPWPQTLGGNAHGQIHLLDKLTLRQPIDPLAELRANPQITPEALAKETKRLGLDKPWYVQYGLWLKYALKGQLGQTNKGESVAWLLQDRAKNTLLLNGVTIALTWALALPLGVLAAVTVNRWPDRILTFLSSAAMALPGFVLALLAGLWVVQTGWLPLGGLTSANFRDLSWPQQALDLAAHLAVPVFVLTAGSVAGWVRQLRSNMLEVLGAEYIQTAKAKGLPPGQILFGHALKNALNPLITLMGFELAALLSGAVLVETVLGYPGLGYLTFQAAISGDSNLVMASLVLSASLLVLGNLVADLTLAATDPRIEA